MSDLSTMELCGVSRIGDGRIVTPAQRYSYSCRFLIPKGAASVELRIRVHAGVLSAGIVAEDNATFLKDAEFTVFDDTPQRLEIGFN